MKKILTLFAVVGMLVVQGCTTNDDSNYVDTDTDTISEVFEVKNVSFNSGNGFETMINLKEAIFDSDVVLVYRLSGQLNSNPIWTPVPHTYYYDDGTLSFSYNFEFSKNNISVYMLGDDLNSVTGEYRSNQVFRIVIVPGYFSSTLKNSSYLEVIKALNLNESKVQNIQF